MKELNQWFVKQLDTVYDHSTVTFLFAMSPDFVLLTIICGRNRGMWPDPSSNWLVDRPVTLNKYWPYWDHWCFQDPCPSSFKT